MKAQDYWCCAVWTLLILLRGFTETTDLDHQQSKCLVAISNNTDGFGVKINCDGGSIEHRQNFTDSYPSPHNANDVLVENIEPVDNGSVHYVLFLPLVREIGILELKYSSLTEQWVVEFIELEGINKPCQILFIVRIVNAHYTVCIYPTDDSNKLEVHEIFFNKTAPQESYINTLNFVNNFGSFDDFTNVVYADRGSTDDDLYIIRDNLISRINPLQHDQTPNEYQLSFDECVNLTCTSLYYIQPKHLLVHCLCCNQTGHCIRHGIRYDTYREDSSIIRMIEGVPYNCPDFKTSVIFRPSTQQISIEHDDSMTPLQLEGDGFREGLCSGNSSNVWFAYQDNTGHVFALDISNSDNLTLHTVAERSCLQGPNCRPISNISDLLIIQEFDDTTQQVFVKGINIYDNYSILFEVTSSQPNFFALVHVPSIIVPLTPSSTYKPHTAVTSLQPSSTTTEKPSHSSSNDILISAVVVAAVVIVIITAILISIIVLLWRKRKNKVEYPMPQAESHQAQELVQPLQAGQDNDHRDFVPGRLDTPDITHPRTVAQTHMNHTDTEEKGNRLEEKINALGANRYP